MKLSLKLEGHDDQHQHTTQLMTAKLPLTIFNHPFISAISASSAVTSTSNTNTNTNTDAEFSFSLSTNFPTGPSLKLSYFPTSPSSSSSLPFSLSLKSGLGLLGSPRHSPLVFSASFTLSPSLTPLPSFFLHFKPQLGHFSFCKTVFSDPPTPKPYLPTASLDHNNNSSNAQFSKGFVSHGSSSCWQELKLEPFGGGGNNTQVDSSSNNNNNNNIGFVPQRSLVEKKDEKRALSPGVAVMARTVMPITKGLLLNVRWGVNLPGDLGVKMPYLTVNKIGLERVVDDVKKNSNINNDKGNETSQSDLQLLKGMCSSMKRDMEAVEKENREMKRVLDEMRMVVSESRSNGGSGGGVGRKSSQQHSGEGYGGEFERWRSNKSVREENEKKDQQKKQQTVVSDVESELQKAIKAAASASS